MERIVEVESVSFESSFKLLNTLSFISLAALLVKVIANIFRYRVGLFDSMTILRNSLTSVYVFPDPAEDL